MDSGVSLRKEPARSGFEEDVVAANGWYRRHWYCYTNRAGVPDSAKRQIRRRERHKAKDVIRTERENL